MIVRILEMSFMLIGGLAVAATSMIVIAHAYSVLCDVREKKQQKLMIAAREKASKHIGQMLQNESYWFSESKEAFTLLNMIGIAMTHTGSFSVSEIRDAWRRSIEAEKTTGGEL